VAPFSSSAFRKLSLAEFLYSPSAHVGAGQAATHDSKERLLLATLALVACHGPCLAWVRWARDASNPARFLNPVAGQAFIQASNTVSALTDCPSLTRICADTAGLTGENSAETRAPRRRAPTQDDDARRAA